MRRARPHAGPMRLSHLGLPVRDARRSLRFYETYFGFDPATARHYEDGTVVVRDAHGFDLALHAVREVAPMPDFLHFGFRLDDPERVRALLARMRADGVGVAEDYDEPAYVAFKCADPDGHRVEAYWEPGP
ncbi:hypothetical protein Pta02_64860 [Planobispora takensis]|uniref:VOC domain-containing protein n=2 Tax=Planobispora takensis TaxID=1367882 RepID=A0A8J3WX36_9ACTN|nr:hypothetical protein Pta02_64860 [Planobispora takensis]